MRIFFVSEYDVATGLMVCFITYFRQSLYNF